MGNEWKKFRLDEVTDLIVDCPHSTPKWTDSGVLVLRSQFIKGGRLNLSNPSFTNEEGYQARIKRAVPSAGDIVLTREAPMGEVCMIPENLKCCLGQRMVLLRAKSDILDSTYLLYTLQSPFLQHQISWNEGTGTTVSNIRIPSIKAFEIPTPDLSVQKKIAHILGSIDNKIQLNRETNQTLEAMAQALFKSWFVDFDPVFDNIIAHNLAHNNAPLHNIPEPLLPHAKRRLNVQNVGRGSARQTAAHAFHHLFPQVFEQSDEPSVGIQGWVPKGWGVETLKERVSILNGCAFKSNDYVDKGTFVLRTKNFNSGIVQRLNDDVFLGQEFLNTHAQYLCEPYDYHLVMVGASVGKTGLIYPHQLPALRNQNMWCFRSKNKDELPQPYVKYLLDSMIAGLLGLASGSAREFFRKGDFGDQAVCMAEHNILISFADITTRILEKKANIEAENLSLESLRDTLLPKLISGELRIPDAEQATEALAK